VTPTRPAALSPWGRLRGSFIGMHAHLAWIPGELPQAVPWILGWQRAVFYVWLPIAILAALASTLAPALGLRLPSPVALGLFGLFLVGYLGGGTVVAAVIAFQGLGRLLRGGARSLRLMALVAGSLLLVALAVVLAVSIARLLAGLW
jgi:hypothetical protein